MGRLWRALRPRLPVRVISLYLSHSGPNLATLVAWNLLFAFFPILVLAVTLASLIPNHAAVGHGIVQAVADALPGGKGTAVAEALRTFHHDGGWLAILGLAGLLWSGSSLFGAMDQAFARLSESKPRGFLAQKLMAFGMIILFACLTVPVVLSSSLLAVLKSVSGIPSLLRSGPVSLLVQIGLAIAVGAILFTAIYTLVPRVRRRLGAVLPGSLSAAVLFEALTLLFPLYFKLAHGFKTYGSTFSLFFLILAYAFLVAQVTVLGFAVVVSVEQGRRPPTLPAPLADQQPEPLAP